jgi:CheY-like chemotaxis protein
MPKPFLAIVDDLFFRAKIDGAARGLGVPGRYARTADEALSAAAVGEPPAVVFVDLNLGSADAAEVIRRAKAAPALSAVPILAFVSHVQVDLARAGQAAGADEVRPRSWFSENLARVLIDRCGGALKV